MRRLWIHTLSSVYPGVELRPGQSDEQWYYENRRNDLKSEFTHWEIKTFDSVGSAYVEASAVGQNVADEKDLLASLWTALDLKASLHTLAGWRLTDTVWPKLINRSLHLNLMVPQAFKFMALQPTRRFSEGGFYDLYNIYKQGIYNRPEVELHEALEFWTGVATHAEHVMAFSHTGRLKGLDIVSTLDDQIGLMEAVARQYDS